LVLSRMNSFCCLFISVIGSQAYIHPYNLFYKYINRIFHYICLEILTKSTAFRTLCLHEWSYTCYVTATQKGFYSHHFAHIRFLMHSYGLIDCFVLLASQQYRLHRRRINSVGPFNCVYFISVTHGCTYWSTSLGSVTVPHDYSHKTSKCLYISQHQEIECRLQVTVKFQETAYVANEKDISVCSDNTIFQFT